VAHDSRAISHGSETVFVALRTPNRDGHDFVADAYHKGVRTFLVERKLPYRDVDYLLCDDSLSSLQTWAMHHRQRFTYPVVAITGSNGKTTVKEWLATLLELHFQLVKSPMSYNSQLGVALSLLQLHPQAEIAIIEAGISQPEEMAILAEMIRPTLGLLTHMGPAHAEGFASDEAKLAEKLLLFADAEQVLASSSQPWVAAQVAATLAPVQWVGRRPSDDLLVASSDPSEAGWALRLRYQDTFEALTLPLTGEANLDNGLLAIFAALQLGLSVDDIRDRLPWLHPVEMRMELISDHPDVSLLNDSYNSDVDSVRQALQQLALQQVHPRKVVILSDIPHLGEQQPQIQAKIYAEAATIAHEVWTVGPVFDRLGLGRHYPDTESLLQALRRVDLAGSSVLLKGARQFELERVIPLLNRKLNASALRIDLNRLRHNFRWLKAHLPEGTKTMCMVKAASYGAGTWEIAQELEKEGTTYLAVAYASEGIELREAGIGTPIMVMNPDGSSIEALLRFDIEPEVSNLEFLQRYLRAARLAGLPAYRVHLKLETGMGRLGFTEPDLPGLIKVLAQHPDMQVVSVMSHLAAADLPSEDAFSQQQVRRFLAMYQVLQQALGLQSFRHIANTAGLLRFPGYVMDMVRLGIGLYGINPVPGLATQVVAGELEEIGSLHSVISQVQVHAAGESVGYGRAQVAERPSRVATVPIGYADGIPRRLGLGNIRFLVRGQWAPTFGRVCMDMLMLDVTDIPEVQAGDEVVLIGEQGTHRLSVCDLAAAADTIPYEILVRLSPRLRRVYVRE
jgi:alanine racemase